MKSIWSQVPLVKIVLPLVVGIGIEIAATTIYKCSSSFLYVFTGLLCLTFVGAIISLRLSVSHQYRWQRWIGVLHLLWFISLGYMLSWLHSEINYPNHFGKFLGKENYFTAIIDQPPVWKEKIVAVVAEVKEIGGEEKKLRNVKGRILLNLLRNAESEKLNYGDRLVCHSKVELFDEPQNPGEFDFKLYQSFHHIYHSAFLREKDWKLIARDKGNPLLAKVYVIRQKFLQILQVYIKAPDDFAVASAMLLGYRDFMGAELVQAYSGTGALHVLCVSGLHVGVVFVILNLLLGWADKKGTKWRIGKAAFIISFIWFYACLTGLSPSVMRAATMFTMIQSGKVLFRHVNIYNVIAGSILVLLLFNPFIITEIGFRLSYLAVIGIIYLQPKIYSLLNVKNWLLDKAWIITSVSIAAQVATFPIGLYYFHQFPSLFLISNLVVIPASNIILFLGVGVFVVSGIPYVSALVGLALAKVIWLLNHFIFFITTIPHALIGGISISMPEMIFVYLFIVLLCSYIEFKRPKLLLAALSLFLAISIFFAVDRVRNNARNELAVYRVNGNRAIAFIYKGTVWHDFDHKLLENSSAMLFHVKHHWWHCGVKDEAPASTLSAELPFGKIICFQHKKILVVDKEVKKVRQEVAEKLKVDYVLLSHNPKVYLTELAKLVDFNAIIFDSSNKNWRTKYWRKDCAQLNIPYWDVNTQGAFITSL